MTTETKADETETYAPTLTTTKGGQVRATVYRVEHDHGDGRLRYSRSFERVRNCTHVYNAQGFVVADIMYGGVAGVIACPPGTELVRLVNLCECCGGDWGLKVPGMSYVLGCEEAWEYAKLRQCDLFCARPSKAELKQ